MERERCQASFRGGRGRPLRRSPHGGKPRPTFGRRSHRGRSGRPCGCHGLHIRDHLDSALESLMDSSLSWVPVLDDDRHVVGTLSVCRPSENYRQELSRRRRLPRWAVSGPESGAFELEIGDDSPAAGRPLRAVGLPRGVLQFTVHRASGRGRWTTGDPRGIGRRPPLRTRRGVDDMGGDRPSHQRTKGQGLTSTRVFSTRSRV